ncbi:MAG: ATP-binding protein [Chloroflexota bacterium]|jgi:signal transduction histidine kinase
MEPNDVEKNVNPTVLAGGDNSMDFSSSVPGQKDSLLAVLTGINASKLGHYGELKKKIRELEISNAQLREAKDAADGFCKQLSRNAEELASLYEKTLVQARKLDWAITSLKSISQVLTNTTHGMDVLLQSVVRTVADLFATEYAVMTVGGEDGTDEVVYCAYGLPPVPMPAVPPQQLLDLASKLAKDRRPILHTPKNGDGLPTVLCVPMLREGMLVGNICLQCQNGDDFSENALSILQTLANQAAIAIENARLFEESRRLQAETRKLYELALRQKDEAERRTLELKQARDELSVMQKEQILNQERNRIARELHDSVAQILISIGLNLEWCRQQLPEGTPIYERILCLKKLARNGVYEIRNAIFELWSSEISEIGLVPALERMTREFQRIASIETDFSVKGDVRRLPTHTETVLYRVTQEALYNAFKHAQATRLDIEAKYGAGEVQLRITDNGVGIDEAAVARGEEGLTYGLKTMLARVREVNGVLEIRNLSREGGGTRVVARVPVKEV